MQATAFDSILLLLPPKPDPGLADVLRNLDFRDLGVPLIMQGPAFWRESFRSEDLPRILYSATAFTREETSLNLRQALAHCSSLFPLIISFGGHSADIAADLFAGAKVLALTASEPNREELATWLALNPTTSRILSAARAPSLRVGEREIRNIPVPEFARPDGIIPLAGLTRQIREAPLGATPPKREPLNVLVLYDDFSTHVMAIQEYVEAFRKYSMHTVHYACATGGANPGLGFLAFDAIVLHYSVRISLTDYISSPVAAALRDFRGVKVLFIQDEWDQTEISRRWMEHFGFHVVYSCIPTEGLPIAYPPSRFPRTRFQNILAGYIPDSLVQIGTRAEATENRPVTLGYRGRQLPYWYGELGFEKMRIGVEMKKICEARGVTCDIDWRDDARLYGQKWYDFLANCRAMLGTEGGANILDEDGGVRAAVEKALQTNPNLTYQEAAETILKPHEGRIHTNQITPKFFEAMALKTALVLFEGAYSGVLRPHDHYIPLKRDFSNVDEVLEKLADDQLIRQMVDRTYREIVSSGRYSYRSFIREFDRELSDLLPRGQKSRFVSQITAFQRPADGILRPLSGKLETGAPSADIFVQQRLAPVTEAEPAKSANRPSWWRRLFPN